MRRLPAKEKPISQINQETDVRVKLIGTVLDVQNGTVVIDDGTGRLQVSFNEDLSYLNQGQMIKVITRVLPLIDGFECRGEVIQILNNFDVELYKQVNNFLR